MKNKTTRGEVAEAVVDPSEVSETEDSQVFPALERLTDRQKRFVIAYCGRARLNASLAARMAGYATTNGIDRIMGYQVKKSPNVQAAIRELLDAGGGSVDEAVYRLSTRARSSIDNVLTIGDDGVVSLDMKRARETDEIHNIKSIRHTKHGISVEMYDAQAADFRLLNHYRNTRLDELDARESEIIEREAALDEEEADAMAGPGGVRHHVDIRYFNPEGKQITDRGKPINGDEDEDDDPG
jgi:phage terminase small subunit